MNAGEKQVEQRRRRKPGKSRHKAANPLRNTLKVDIEDLLLRFFLSSPRGLSSLSFDGFKECWLTPDKHFTLIHYTFATSRVDYTKLLQTMFQITLSCLDRIPIKKLQDLAPEIYGPDEVDINLLSAAWNMSVVFCLYCIHGTQFEVDYQDSKASNKSHMEVLTHSELEEKTPIRISMSMYMRLVVTANLQFSHFANTQLGRCTFAILDHLRSTNAFCFSAFTGPVLHEEFDETPGNSSNHIIEAFSLEDIWRQMKGVYSDLSKKKELIGAMFVDCPRAVNQSWQHMSKRQEREHVNSFARIPTKIQISGKQAPSGQRQPMYVGFKRGKVQEVHRSKPNNVIQKQNKGKTSVDMERLGTTSKTTVIVEQESTLQPQGATKSSEALAEELAAMFDESSSRTDTIDTTESPMVASRLEEHETYIAELTRLERETDEVLNVVAKEDNVIARKRNESSNRRVRSQVNKKHTAGKKHKTLERRAHVRNHIDILEGLEQNLHDILDS